MKCEYRKDSLPSALLHLPTTSGNVVMNSLIEKYKVQEMATEEELKWVEHLYNCYVNEYLREKNGLNRVFF